MLKLLYKFRLPSIGVGIILTLGGWTLVGVALAPVLLHKVWKHCGTIDTSASVPMPITRSRKPNVKILILFIFFSFCFLCSLSFATQKRYSVCEYCVYQITALLMEINLNTTCHFSKFLLWSYVWKMLPVVLIASISCENR